jgi:hypothetical protein
MVMVIDRVAKMSLRNSEMVRIVADQLWKYLKPVRAWLYRLAFSGVD